MLDTGPNALPLATTRPSTARVISHTCGVPSALGTRQGHGEAEVAAFTGLPFHGGGLSDLLEGVMHAVTSSRGGDRGCWCVRGGDVVMEHVPAEGPEVGGV